MLSLVIVVLKKKSDRKIKKGPNISEPEVLYLFYQVQKFYKSIIYW